MTTIPEALALATQYHQGGRLHAAEQIFRQILAVEPNHVVAHNNLGNVLRDQQNLVDAVACYRQALALGPDVAEIHNNLGVVLKDQGNLDEAVAYCRRAVELKSDFAEAHNSLGIALKDQGNVDEAVACYRRALDLKPNVSDVHNNLGVALREQGNLDEAAACCRRALELEPDFPAALYNLANVLRDQGKLDEAVICCRRALNLKPEFAEACIALGNTLKDQGSLDEAVACYRRALDLKPDVADVLNNLGVALRDQGNLDEAIACCRRALELKPDFALAHNNLGNALKDQGNLDEAVACYRLALDQKPDVADVHNNLGVAMWDQGKLDEAVACYRRALELKPDFPEAHNNLGNALKDQGNLDEAIACCRRALDLKPDYAAAHSNLLLARQYCADVTLAGLAAAHAEYDRQHAASLRGVAARHDVIRDHQGRLRLGFVSPDLGRHPVGYFLVRVLENLSQEQHETFCYSDRLAKDSMTQRLQAAATHWRDVYGISDQRLAEQIRADQIDILFDLAGHTAHNRLLVFARKPAPVQVTWAGYVGTTGLAAMDYILADRYEIPAQSETGYCEKVLRMPDGYVCYDPPGYAAPVSSLPALACGYVTFGSFNNPTKISPQALEVWSRILHRLPNSRLVLKYKGMSDPTNAKRLATVFSDLGIDPVRLEFLGYSPHAEAMAEYCRIDLALDPFPYSGGLTTCESLWMGVPVITCPGETFASRHSLSHLSNVGLTETIARNLDEYEELAVSLASDLPRLAMLRAGLRDRMAASPLCDGKRFAANFASMLREIPISEQY